GNLITDTLSARLSNYQEQYTASWQPRLDIIEPINWIGYSAHYAGGFQWRNSPAGSQLGATISNNFSLNQTLTLDVRHWLERMPWYQNLQGDELEGTPGASEEAPWKLGDIFARIGREGLQALLSIQSIDVSFN